MTQIYGAKRMFQSAGEVRKLPVEFCVWPISFQMTAAIPQLNTFRQRKQQGTSFVTSKHLAVVYN